VTDDPFKPFSLTKANPKFAEVDDSLNRAVMDVYVKFMASRIVIARIELAKREGRYHGGPRRKRRTRP